MIDKQNENIIPELDESENNDDIITLLSATGEEVDFIEIAGIAHNHNFYAILQPVELIEGMEDDEALVFKVTRDENGNDKFEIEHNMNCNLSQWATCMTGSYGRLV